MAGVTKLPSGTWRGWYKDYNGKRQFFFITKAASRREVLTTAQDLELRDAKIRLGVLPHPGQQHTALTRPTSEVITEYLTWGQSQGGRGGGPWSPAHLRTLTGQLAWWHTRLSLKALADCQGILPSVERLLREQATEGLASKSRKHYSTALEGFFTWCVRRRYLPRHPLEHLTPIRVTRTSERRQLTAVERSHLLEACAPDHVLLYVTAICTGLRANALRQLSLAHLDTQHGGLQLDAAWTKNRKATFLPLESSLLAALYGSGRSGTPGALYARAREHYGYPACPLLYVPRNSTRLLDTDLRRAGIAKHTDQGKMDFHALRTTCVNLVIDQGAVPTEFQALVRHHTAKLTLEIYGRTHDARLVDLMEGIAAQVVPHTWRASGVHARASGEGSRAPRVPSSGVGLQDTRRHSYLVSALHLQ